MKALCAVEKKTLVCFVLIAVWRLGGLEAAPSISQIQFPAQVSKFAKFEVTFQIGSTTAQNLQWPYDPAPPPGVPAGTGISVDILVTPDNWATVHAQPAFYYQEFLNETRDGKPWSYPTGNFSWKARFSPPTAGAWQFKLRARDAGGTSESPAQSFTVLDSSHPGFVRVSSRDPRYFEHDDGTFFPGLGYNLQPRLTEAEIQSFAANGIQLLRVWWSSLSIFGSQWNPYYELRNQYLGYVPRTGLVPFTDDTTGETSIKMRIDYEAGGNTGWFDGCRVIGTWGPPQEVKPNTTYRISVKYRGFNIAGPRNAVSPAYGFVVKTGVATPGQVFEPGVGNVLTNYGLNTPSGWGTLDGSWSSGTRSFLPSFYFVMENVTQGEVYVDSVSLREHLGGGQLGPEILHKPSMEHHLYFQQHDSFWLDQIMSWAEQYGVYLKAVILEKDEKITKKIGFDGSFTNDSIANFYGNYRQVTKVRWLQQAWWRYLQARWGYSPNLHSWELCNEGDPAYGSHFALTDELGKFMHGRVFGVAVADGDGIRCQYRHPNAHLVTTSFWHSLPSNTFWANAKYPNVDYVDVHAYISTGWLNNPAHETDAALYHLDYSAECRKNVDYYSDQAGWPTKPIVRGEAGIDFVNTQAENPDLARDTQGIWLHNYLWSCLDPGALYEQYWWKNNLRSQPGPDGQPGLYEVYKSFFDFVRNLPVNNGRYADAAAAASDPGLRVVGQKNVTDSAAHLWIQNRQHTWRNVVDNVSIAPVSGTVTVSGFTPLAAYALQWWNTYQGGWSSNETVTASTTGTITIAVPPLVTDLALKLTRTAMPSAPAAPTGLKLQSIQP
ncbi:MAG: hypothetical protein ACE15E_07670 [Acidobacteriota bacterium]